MSNNLKSARSPGAVLNGSHRLAREGEERRAKFVRAFEEIGDLQKALDSVPIKRSTYLHWRQRDKDWAARFDATRAGVKRSDTNYHAWDGTFVDFRLKYFGMESPGFHLRIIAAIEQAKPGEITMILVPPEHGKTTLLEDYASMKLALNPEYRITVGSEGQPHARKFLTRVRNRMEPHGPYPEYVAKFGPFVPQIGGSRKTNQPWGADFFDVWKKGGYDERDYSMAAAGITSAIAGRRCDDLILDDVQSMRNLSSTEAMVNTFRQDWLSRPGSLGRTFIIGTRVSDNDFYEALLDADIIDHLIVIPAHEWTTPWPGPITRKSPPPDSVKFLWPERYSPANYVRMRSNVGESAWQRNYMQAPRKAGASTFTEDMVLTTVDSMRSVLHDPPVDVKLAVLGLDPGYGINAWMACGMTEEQLVPLSWRLDLNLANTQGIMQIGREIGDTVNTMTCSVSDIMVEDKAFQHGLLEDESLLELAKHFGARIDGHQTGSNKYDENIGIPAMARSFLRGEIRMPGASDASTTAAVEQLVSELVSWRPYKRGNRLRQDLVMALWFCWLKWRDVRLRLTAIPQPIEVGGLPWQPMNVRVVSA